MKSSIFAICITVSALIPLVFVTGKNQVVLVTQNNQEKTVEFFLDSIPPGPITVKKLLSVKKIRVATSDATGKIIELKITSGTIGLWSNKNYGGSGTDFSLFVPLTNGQTKLPLSHYFKNVRPGCNVALTDLKIDGVGKYKALNSPNWAVVGE